MNIKYTNDHIVQLFHAIWITIFFVLLKKFQQHPDNLTAFEILRPRILGKKNIVSIFNNNVRYFILIAK